MNRLIIPILFIICCVYYSCTDDNCNILLVERQPIDPCENKHIVACSFEFREGKWLQLQDTFDTTEADTIWFKQDSLIGWSFQGEAYKDLTGYFIGNYIYSQPWNSGGQGPVSSRGTFTSYNDTTGVLTIEWTGGLQTIDYYKID